MTTLKFTGWLISLGYLDEDDWRCLSESRATLELPDGRLLMIIGMTPDECRALADAFDERVSVTVQQVEATS